MVLLRRRSHRRYEHPDAHNRPKRDRHLDISGSLECMACSRLLYSKTSLAQNVQLRRCRPGNNSCHLFSTTASGAPTEAFVSLAIVDLVIGAASHDTHQ